MALSGGRERERAVEEWGEVEAEGVGAGVRGRGAKGRDGAGARL